MSNSLLAWLIVLAAFTGLSIRHPVCGLLAYMQTFFFAPSYWWWGKPLAEYRWALITGFVALIAGLLYTLRQHDAKPYRAHRSVYIANLLMVTLWLNATLVHLSLAPVSEISAPAYWELSRFVVLVFVFQMCVRTPQNLESVLLFILIGLAYIGYEVTINDRGAMIRGRLEGVGVPGGAQANELGSLIVTFLPIVAIFFINGRWWQQAVAVICSPFILNLLLLCNSRGAFLGAIVMATAFFLFCPKRHRRKGTVTLLCGLLALYLLLGDQRIVDRFLTVFRSGEQRDESAKGRLRYWQAGVRMIADHPFGRGGDAFSKMYGPQYIAEGFDEWFDSRSVHQGFINEACDWGIQGLALRVCALVIALHFLWKRLRYSSWNTPGHIDPAIIAASLFAGTLGFLTTCCFGSVLDNEWGYWVIAFAVLTERIYVEIGEDHGKSTRGVHMGETFHGYTYSPSRMIKNSYAMKS